jgi:HAD superfamily hydrolase (TIGR01493 family)
MTRPALTVPSAPIGPSIRAVVFDAFGTLVEIRDNKRPYGRLMKWIRDHHGAVAGDEARWLMTRSLDLRAVVAAAGARAPADMLRALEHDLAIELASITAFADSAPALAGLRQRGLKVAVCSNLIACYAPPVRRVLPFAFDAEIWSFAAGAIKPEPVIYRAVCEALALSPGEILFVGDTFDADVEGPKAFGMKALLIDRDQSPARPGSIAALTGLLANSP